VDYEDSASAEEHKAKYVSEGLRKELSRIGIIELRAGRSRPQRKTQELQVAILKSLGNEKSHSQLNLKVGRICNVKEALLVLRDGCC
jgi:hypothetical protein